VLLGIYYTIDIINILFYCYTQKYYINVTKYII